MKAIILAGGLGTRLRPLTYSVPKPLIPLLGKPLIRYIIDALPAQVDTVVLAVSYMKDALEDYFKSVDLGRRVILINETEPLGTGGAIRNASDHLDGTFLAFNGDIVSSLDLKALLKFHREKEGIATLSLWQVPDPSAFGVVKLNAGGRVLRFQEKPRPEEAVSNLINAGAYVFEEDILDFIGPGKVSIEKEVFPKLLNEGLYGTRFQGYWVDCGTREALLNAQRELLNRSSQIISPLCQMDTRVTMLPPNHVGSAILKGCTIGPHVFVEDNVSIDDGSHVSNSMIMQGARIGAGARVINSILGPGARVEDDEHIADAILMGQ